MNEVSCFTRLWMMTALLCVAVRPANAMTTRVVQDQVIVSGPLTPPDVDRFAKLLDGKPAITTVILWNSPGGAFEANRGLTKLIADRKLDTAVAGFCLSACAMVFLAGNERYFSDGESLETTMLGFHGSYTNGHLAPEERLQFLRGVVEDETGDKADPAIVERWLHLAEPSDFVRFYYPGSDGNPRTDTVFECTKGGPYSSDYGGGGPYSGDSFECMPVAGHTALSMGIITSTRILHVAK